MLFTATHNQTDKINGNDQGHDPDYSYENADFSRNTIKDSIKNGELKANEILPLIGWEKCTL